MDIQYPLITLAIPVYNTEQFLEKCITSAIAQDYPNLEILILNNGSTDGSQHIIDKYKIIDSRIVSYTIPHVGTVKESKDNCYYRAKGDWIVTLDSDDYIDDGYVSELWKRSSETKTEVVVATMVSVDFEGNIISVLPRSGFNYTEVLNGVEAVRRTIQKWVYGLNGALVNKKCLKNVYVNNPSCRKYTDEVDGRLFLLEAQSVSFSPARYFHTRNPNSTGQRPSWNRFKYKIVTRKGLLEIVESVFGTKSDEYNSLIYQSLGVVFLALKFIWSYKSHIEKDSIKEFKEISMSLLESLDFKTFRISNFVYYPLKLIFAVLVRLA